MNKILYVAHATSRRGRNGFVETDGSTLKFQMASPDASAVRPWSTNPEQLFACAYAACFGSALEFVLQQEKITGIDPVVRTGIALHQDAEGYFLSAEIGVSLPGIEKARAEKLVRAANMICPYSKATHGNIETSLRINDQTVTAAA